MTPLVKICGITDIDTALCVQENKADFIGFVFFEKSPRHIKVDNYAQICRKLSDKIQKVIVTVDMEDDELDMIISSHKPHYVQFHGNESLQRIKHIKQKYDVRIIKAFPVRNGDDIASSLKYKDVADIILYDAKASNSDIPGGNGLSFDWSLLKNRNFDFNWMLSGGLNLDNIGEALKVTNAQMIDLSSAVESSAGVKDIDLIKKFLTKVKS